MPAPDVLAAVLQLETIRRATPSPADRSVEDKRVSLCWYILDRIDRTRDSRLWAITQLTLGNACARLVSLTGETSHLGAAISAYQAALEDSTRGTASAWWATTHMSLGQVLLRQYDVGPDPEVLRLAAAALEEALLANEASLDGQIVEQNFSLEDQIHTLESYGRALLKLGEIDHDPTKFEKAMLVVSGVLRQNVLTRTPGMNAKTQLLLAKIQARLGEATGDEAPLEGSIINCRQALLELTYEDTPEDWAAAQSVLVQALARLGQLLRSRPHLSEAVVICQQTLVKLPKENYPTEWAVIQNNLGVVLTQLSQV